MVVEMSASTEVLHPPVLWAQRNNVILLTISVEDCLKPEIKIEPLSLHFKGIGGADKNTYEVTMDFYKEIDPEKSKHMERGRNIEVVLTKKEEGPYWPHLLKDKRKCHWLKVDFNRWRDEDDSDEDTGGGNQDLEQMMRQMGGLGGGGLGDMGMPDMGGDSSKPDLNDLDSEDSDDEDLPDLE